MKKIGLLNIIIFVIIGCNSDQDSKELTKTNLTKCIDSMSTDGYSNKYCEKYYSSGELMETYMKKDSILDGTYKVFYKNGNIKDSSFYVGGYKYGWSESFYLSGNKKSLTNYVTFDTDYSYRNQYAEYDSLTGELNYENSFFYSMDLLQKNVKIGDSITVDFYFDCPVYNDSSFIKIGKFDEFYRLPIEEEDNLLIVPIINKSAKFKVSVSNEKGIAFIRGIVCNFNFQDTSKYRNFYFNEKYYVE